MFAGAGKKAKVLVTIILISVTIYMNFYTRIQNEISKVKKEQASDLMSDTELHFSANATLRSLILLANMQQTISNENYMQSNNNDIIILVQVHDRIHYLSYMISSLQSIKDIRKRCTVIFSHDVYSPAINEIVRSIKHFPVIQIFYPYMSQIYPHGYPPDPREECKHLSGQQMLEDSFCKMNISDDDKQRYTSQNLSSMKHHWWWKANFVFEKLRIMNREKTKVLFVEDDFYISPDIVHVIDQFDTIPECKASIWTMGLEDLRIFPNVAEAYCKVVKGGFRYPSIAASVWNYKLFQRVRKHYDFFCSYNDYNWDWTLARLMLDFERNLTVCQAAKNRATHLGICGTHFHSIDCSGNDLFKRTALAIEEEMKFMFKNLTLLTINNAAGPITSNGNFDSRSDELLCFMNTLIGNKSTAGSFLFG